MDHLPPAPGAFSVAVELVVLSVRDAEFCAHLVLRSDPPVAGGWALPGGFVEPREGLTAAAARHLRAAAGPAAGRVHLEQLASYGGLAADPRMPVVTIAYLALVSGATSGQGAGRWVPVGTALCEGSEFAFDHGQILADGVARLRGKLEYSPLAAALCPDEFTVGELRRVYEAVWSVKLDPRNFHRKVTGSPGFLIAAGATTARQGGRPAQLYRRGPATLLSPPMFRPEV
ncbi:MAG: NUDIX hydrolase [Streptomycetales bacterium]